MPFIPLPDTVQVETVFKRGDVFAENVYNVQMGAAYDETNIANLLDTFRTWWDTDMQPLVSADWSLVNLIGTDMDTQTGPRVEDSTGLPLVGGVANEGMPNHVTIVIKWTTGSRGRSFRGRTYHVGLAETQVTGNSPTGTVLTSLQSAYANLLTAVATAGHALVVASRYTNGSPRTTGVVTPITGLSINPIIDSQRRRLPERGT